jgi:hypothetical protein
MEDHRFCPFWSCSSLPKSEAFESDVISSAMDDKSYGSLAGLWASDPLEKAFG